MNQLKIPISIEDNFCNFFIKIDDQIIGNPDEWSVCGLMHMELSKTIHRLRTNSLSKKENENFEDIFKIIKSNYELTSRFSAIPLNNEIFDGEFSFIIQDNNGDNYLTWSNFNCNSINTIAIDKEFYIDQLLKIEHAIGTAIKNRSI